MLYLNGVPKFPKPQNAALVSFLAGSKEAELLKEEIKKIRNSEPSFLPLLIGGEKVANCDKRGKCVSPHDFERVLARYAIANPSQVNLAIESALKAKKSWESLPYYMRLHIFRKAAYLLETKYYYKAIAAVMEDYSKNPFEAMIDVNELIDFWNFNVYFADEIYREQPDSLKSNFNFIDWRPLEGFVFAIPPNNFISIALNLPTAALIMGNVCVVKPAKDTVYSFHLMLDVLAEAGLPMEVLSVIPALAGVHFTGGTSTFNYISKIIGANIEKYATYPRLVGETGGKDFIIIEEDADLKEVAAAIIVSAFGYQGQKCSAASRIYISNSKWAALKPILIEMLEEKIKVGDVADFRNYLGAVISEERYKNIVEYIENANRDTEDVKEIIGGYYNATSGWFIWPTIIVVENPHYKTMEEEIFGPVATICVLKDADYYNICDKTSSYGLTGSIITADIFKLCEGLQSLRYSAGNIYDWKTTGAVVGQQPFGGARKSGTDDKAGSKLNLYKWTAPRTISLLNEKPKKWEPGFLEK